MFKRALTIILMCGSLFSYGQTSSVNTGTSVKSPVTMSYEIRDFALSENREDSRFFINLDNNWEKIPATDSLTVSYKNIFETDRSWLDRNIFLVTEGKGQAVNITLNGKKAGCSTDRGVLRFNLNGSAVMGRNEIIISYAENPNKAYNSGINGYSPVNTYVFSQPKIYITDYNISSFTDGKGNGILNTGITVENGYNTDAEVTAGYDVTDMNGDLITYNSITDKMEKGERREFILSRKISGVQKWSPDNPYLYTVTFRIRYQERYIEYITVKVGFRDIETADGKLFINGKETVLNGHITEKPDSLTVKELKELKKNGINCLTWTEQPVNERIYDLCDSLGMFVCCDITVNGKEGNTSDDPSLTGIYTDRIYTIFQRLKNRPSVIMWSLGNDRKNGYNLYKSYLYTKTLDRTRPVITRAAKDEWNTDISTTGKGVPQDNRGVLLFGGERAEAGKNIIGTFSK